MSETMYAGTLATNNIDPYFEDLPETEWFVQVWHDDGNGVKTLQARFYGETPERARSKAQRYVNALGYGLEGSE